MCLYLYLYIYLYLNLYLYLPYSDIFSSCLPPLPPDLCTGYYPGVDTVPEFWTKALAVANVTLKLLPPAVNHHHHCNLTILSSLLENPVFIIISIILLNLIIVARNPLVWPTVIVQHLGWNAKREGQTHASHKKWQILNSFTDTKIKTNTDTNIDTNRWVNSQL